MFSLGLLMFVLSHTAVIFNAASSQTSYYNVNLVRVKNLGTPPLNVFWKNLKTGQVTKEKLMNIINV